MDIKKEKIIIIGPSGSGKDFLRKKLIDKGLKSVVKITTRLPRKGELNNEDYLFINNEDLNYYIENKDILTLERYTITSSLNNNTDVFYMILKDDFINSQVCIMTINEFNSIDFNLIERKNIFVVYLNIDEDIRKNRLLNRNDLNDSILRRVYADNQDFKDFKDYDMMITDPEFNADDIFFLMF